MANRGHGDPRVIEVSSWDAGRVGPDNCVELMIENVEVAIGGGHPIAVGYVAVSKEGALEHPDTGAALKLNCLISYGLVLNEASTCSKKMATSPG